LILKIKIILASTSRYRADLLKRLQIPFDVAKPAIDESPHAGESPADTALRLAIAKALVVADAPNQTADTLIIGSDQVADLNGKQLGKPGTRENAILQLQAMRGQTVIFHTAVALVHAKSRRIHSRAVPTEVTFRDYSDREIENYLDREDALDCAGSAKSEGLGAALISRMKSDDPTALIGLPLLALMDMLAEENIRVLA
jgi:septum formation protein